MLRGRLGSNRDLVDERTKGGIARIDDVELFLFAVEQGALILSMAKL
jgi:hypothetical protein